MNDIGYIKWLDGLDPDINIIDTVSFEEGEYWLEFYKNLFASWGFKLFSLNTYKTLYEKRVCDIYEIFIGASKNVNSNQIPNRNSDLDQIDGFIEELEKIYSKTKSQLIFEMVILCHCLFLNGIPLKQCMKLKTEDVLFKGYTKLKGSILPYSEFLKEKIRAWSQMNQNISNCRILTLQKSTSKSNMIFFVIILVNSVSNYLGFPFNTTGNFFKEFGQITYRKYGQMEFKVLFLARLFKCNSRLELLCKLDVIPKLRSK